MLFAGTGGVFAQDNANLFWDDTNNRLGLGTATPGTLLHLSLADAGTNSVATLETFDHITSGAAADGFGSSLLWSLEDGGGTLRSAARQSVSWATAAAGTRKARLTLSVFDTAERTGLQVDTDGTVAYTFHPGDPPASASLSKMAFGSQISSGSANGTFHGINATAGFTGDLVNWQVNGTSVFVATGAGRLGLGIAPTYRLDVVAEAGNDQLVCFRDALGNPRFQMFAATGNTFWFAPPSDAGVTTHHSSALYFATSYWDGASNLGEAFGLTAIRYGTTAGTYVGWFTDQANTVVWAASGTGGHFAVGYEFPGASTGQFHVRSRLATTPAQVWQLAASQSAVALRLQTDTPATLWEVSQTGAHLIRPLDAVTNAVTIAATLGHATSGTPAAGFGNEIRFQLQSSTTADRDAGGLSVEWATATDATRKARGKLLVYDTAVREAMRWEADGANPMVGFLGAAAVVRQTAAAAATDLATVIALANSLRTGLLNNGLFA